MIICFLVALILTFSALSAEPPWERHTIDQSFKGADGVRLGDINQDGLPDITTGWEEGGRVRVYLHPGSAHAKKRWPAVTAGEVASPEDAFFMDVNGDGELEVVSSCEGRTKAIYVHWAPADREKLLNASAWKTELFRAADRSQMWMYGISHPHEGRATVIAGSKGEGASVTWFLPGTGGLEDWRAERLLAAGWIMSLMSEDINLDGRLDLLISDRRGQERGVLWLEASVDGQWSKHRIGLEGKEVMFIDFADINNDTRKDVIAAVKPRRISFLFAPENGSAKWRELSLDLPETVGRAKAVRVGDLNLDGKPDVVFTCEGAEPPLSGAVWVELKQFSDFEVHDIAGPEGVKFDRIELLDLDADGDLDVVTCEESANLGVIWYENPAR